LSVWEDAITDTFVKYFRGVKNLPEIKTYFDSLLLRIELSNGTASFNTDSLIVAGVKFVNGIIAKKIAECITLALLPQMTAVGQPKHFTYQFTADKREKLYNDLTQGGYLPKDTPKNHFDFVFGIMIIRRTLSFYSGKNRGRYLLFIDTLFGNLNVPHWGIAKECFQIKGKELNIDTLKKRCIKK
jgi:hypothetical protein